MAATIRAVLFDFDGTLSDSEYLHREAWLEAVEPLGVTADWKEYESKFIGISDRRAGEIFIKKAGLEASHDLVSDFCRRKHSVYRRRCVEELTIHGEVVEWISSRATEVPLGVVSSSPTPDVVPILEKHGVAELMKFFVCGEHVTKLKPDPMPYLLALDKMRPHAAIEHPEQCLVFEDSSSGVAAATAAGMTVHRLASPDDLPAALAEWETRIAAPVQAG